MSDYLEIARQVMRAQQMPQADELENVLKGLAIELWSNASGERFWLVADEADAARLGERRGSVYTAGEARRVIQVGDVEMVAEIHRWKRQFDTTIKEYAPAEGITPRGITFGPSQRRSKA